MERLYIGVWASLYIGVDRQGYGMECPYMYV